MPSMYMLRVLKVTDSQVETKGMSPNSLCTTEHAIPFVDMAGHKYHPHSGKVAIVHVIDYLDLCNFCCKCQKYFKTRLGLRASHGTNGSLWQSFLTKHVLTVNTFTVSALTENDMVSEKERIEHVPFSCAQI